MFASRKDVKALTDRIEALEKRRVTVLGRDGHDRHDPFSFLKFRDVPVEDAIKAILDHLKLQLYAPRKDCKDVPATVKPFEYLTASTPHIPPTKGKKK